MIEQQQEPGSADFAANARRIRATVLRMIHHAQSSHVGSSLSIVDLLVVLYGAILRIDPLRPAWPDRDRLILSKGHGCSALYAILAEKGFFPEAWLATYCQDGGHLAGHADSHGVPGLEASTGSLGHGLALANGMALAGKYDRKPYRAFVILSDGECDEGAVWEAALFAAHQRLDNLVAIVDHNKLQGMGSTREVLDLGTLAEKWHAFGWATREIDGHDHDQILETLSALPFEPGRPSAIVAHTVKGKGVSFMENEVVWHYRPPNDAQLAQALAELRQP